MKIYLFPFAGASAYSYPSLVQALSGHGLEITSLELPGRGLRRGEALLSDMREMADDLFEQVTATLSLPYAFYGHSMGSLLAYEVILRIMDHGIVPPVHLFVSGRGGPGLPPGNREIGLLPREEFFKKLEDYGGTPLQVLGEKELMDFFEPILRADFNGAGSYNRKIFRKIHLPVTVFNGTEDRVSFNDCLLWQEVTDLTISVNDFKGGHFFIAEHADALGRAITHELG